MSGQGNPLSPHVLAAKDMQFVASQAPRPLELNTYHESPGLGGGSGETSPTDSAPLTPKMGETPAGTAADSVLPYDINVPDKVLTDEQVRRMKYRDYLPTWEPVFFPPLKPFEFRDPALDAKDNLVRTFSPRGVRFEDIQPKMGTIVRGLQLTGLGPDEKNQLARLVAERKVVVFEDQDFVDAGPAFQESWMRHFGKLNYQPVSGSIKGHPAFQINQRAGNKDEIDRFLEQHTTTTLWHQDVSFEIQPPGYVLLGMFEGPPCGGDTIFCDAEQAFDLLSPPMRAFIETLSATHTSARMIGHTRERGGLVRKDPVTTSHPLVRRHPVTGCKAIFLNGEFVTAIEGLKITESKMLMDFLINHMVAGHDFQCRVRWSPRAVVMFDNRSILHTAVVDYIDEMTGAKPRHIFRLCAMAEKPIPATAPWNGSGYGLGVNSLEMR